MFRRSHKVGFTLIELLVVIAIIAILAAILFPVFAQARNAARKATCISNLKQLALGQQMYLQDYDERMTWWDPGTGRPQDSWNTPQGAGWWMNEVYPYIKNYGIYECPNDARSDDQAYVWGYAIIPNTNPIKYYRSSYGISEWLTNYQGRFIKLAGIPQPASTALFADSEGPLFNDWDSCGGQFPYGFTRIWYANYDAWGPWGQEQNYEKYKEFARHNLGSVIAYVDGHAGYIPNRGFFMQNGPNGVCPADGKKEKPLIYPNHIPY